uniref:Myb/SANT-like domain-containing protein n=1 Tax=Setaria viridis TaxID=4556 RepID=A0A4U6TZ44_SETVI|nr:uncharacterized protein LOC117865601 [Setaria viridis]TKW06159.1 hypothetical protein SEVIR_7G223950v2 [Setaria viridis]
MATMDHFNEEGDGTEFNAGGSRLPAGFTAGGSGNPAPFNAGGYGDGSSGLDFGNVPDYDAGHRTRNLFSLTPPGSGSGAYNPFSSVPQQTLSSTLPTPSQLGMSGLNLNATSGWPNMNDYEGILRSGDRVGGGGSSRVGPPGGEASGSGGQATAPLPRQRRPTARARGSRRRGAAQAVEAENNPNEPSRAKWTKEDTQVFCELYCQQIELGNCKSGNMSKWGWKDVQEKFLAATGKFKNSEQFGYKYRQLKLLWQFIQDLRTKCTSLGHREDGSVIASDKWWQTN